MVAFLSISSRWDIQTFRSKAAKKARLDIQTFSIRRSNEMNKLDLALLLEKKTLNNESKRDKWMKT